MKRHFPGLHAEAARKDDFLEGIFLVRVDRAYYRWHPQKPFFFSASRSLRPRTSPPARLQGGSIAPKSPCGNSIGSCGISAMTRNCSVGTRWMRRP